MSGVPSTALPLKVFRTTDLFELVRDTESGASAVGLAILSNGRAACSLGLLHGSLSSLLDVLHNAPPRLATASKCTADERTPDGPLYEMLTVLVAQAYHVSWRLLSSLPPTRAVSPTPHRPAAATIHEMRSLLASQNAAAGAAGKEASTIVCARLPAAITQDLRGSDEDPMIERSAALVSGLSYRLERLARPAMRHLEVADSVAQTACQQVMRR